MRRSSAWGTVIALVGLLAMAAAPAARAQQADDEPVGWPLPKSERPKKPKSDRTPLLPVAPAPQASASAGSRTAEAAERSDARKEEGLPPASAEAGSVRQPAAGAAGATEVARERRSEEEATVGELVPLDEVTLGAKPLVFAFSPDQYALTADEVRLIERFAAGVRAASGIVDVLVWVMPPADADEQARRKALERAFARGLYLRALLREAGLPAARIDMLATARPAPREKDMPAPPPKEGARIRLVSDFMTGVR